LLDAQADVAPEVEVAEPDDGQSQAVTVNDEEIARLRWRNRYLEGRLAYFEEEGEPSTEIEAESGSTDAVQSEPVETLELPAIVSTPEPEEAQSEPVVEEAEQAPILDVGALDEAVSNVEEAEVHPAEAMFDQLSEDKDAPSLADPVQPEQSGEPQSGGDNLAQIEGIGPRIAEELNRVGVWSFKQIAAWSPENARWIEEHLGFDGRVTQEDWVKQAETLVAQPTV